MGPAYRSRFAAILGWVKSSSDHNGLGNVLYQIAAGMSCGAEPLLIHTRQVLFGSRADCKTCNTSGPPYTETILRNFQNGRELYETGWRAFRSWGGSHSALRMNPGPCPSGNFTVRNFGSRHPALRGVPQMLPRLWYPPVPPRYQGCEGSTCLGLRLNSDYPAYGRTTKAEVEAALHILESQGEPVKNLLLFVDRVSVWHGWKMPQAITVVNESDVEQLAVGRQCCRNYFISESTYHVWMAYVSQPRLVIATEATSRVGLDRALWHAQPWVILQKDGRPLSMEALAAARRGQMKVCSSDGCWE